MTKRLLTVCGGVILAALASCTQNTEKPKAEATPPPAAPAAPAKEAPKAPAPEAKAPPATPAPATPAPAKKEKLASDDPDHKDWFISLEKAKELFDKKEINKRQVIFIDARTYFEFTTSHIRGAMCYSTKYTEGPPQPKARNYLPGSAIVIYCHGDLCTDSLLVGKYFLSLNMDIGPVFIIKDGFPGWEKAYPTLIDKGGEIGFD